jgi:hypothetical protein
VLRDHRQRALADEGANRVSDEALVVAEQIIDLVEIRWRQCPCPWSALGDSHALRVPE